MRLGKLGERSIIFVVERGRLALFANVAQIKNGLPAFTVWHPQAGHAFV